MYNLPGYVSYPKCNCLQRSGGTLIFVVEYLSCIRILKNPIIVTADCVHLKIILADNTSVEILGIYRLQEFSPNRFTIELDNYLHLIKNKNLIICGDININLLEATNCVNNYLMVMANHGLDSKVKEPTRIKNNSFSLIDHVFVRWNVNSENEMITWVIDSQITDHFMTSLSIKHDRGFKRLESNISKRIIDFQKLNKALREVDWRVMYTSSTVSIAFTHFSNILESCIQSSFRLLNHKKNIKKLKPWMTEELLIKVNTKNSLYRDCLKEPLNVLLKDRYVRSKTLLKQDISKCKNEYYKTYLESNKLNPRRQWKCVKELIGDSRSPLIQLSVKDANGSVESDPEIVANIFNNFFSSVANDLRLNIDRDKTFIRNARTNLDFAKDKYSKNSLFLYPTNCTEIQNIINTLSARKAPGYDSITSVLVKGIAGSIIEHLVYLTNFSMSSGEFPNDLKNAIVVPLYKKSDKQCPSNYRPIALLSIFSKILEKILKSRLVNFLEKEGFFSKNQYGFQKNTNTENALLDFFGKVYEGINDGNFCAGIFVDVMKAFDTVDRTILLEKMYKAGIRGVAYELFLSYLSGRKQRVRVGDKLSEEVEIIHGIPQGSVLSGPLFLIYVNSLCDGIFKGMLTAFADDTSLFYRSKTLQDLQNSMQNDINLLRLWFTDNCLAMSPKTQALMFNLNSKKRVNLSLRYHEVTCTSPNCNCVPIALVDEIKYLGLFVDSRLSWKIHINYIKNKVIKYTRIFYLLRPFCGQDLLRTLYFAFVNSKLEYALTLWGGTYNTTMKAIVVQQNSFIRIIDNKSKLEHALPIYRKLEILPIKNLYIYKVLKVYYNTSNKQREDIRKPTVILRNRLDAYVPRPRLTLYRKFFTYLAPKFYNCLPHQIKIINKLSKFLRVLKTYLLFHDNISMFYDCLE